VNKVVFMYISTLFGFLCKIIPLQSFVQLHVPWSYESENESKEMQATFNCLHE